ncbi:chorismate synthase [Chryseotalea sanaruensis]|uniref:Chorismate synthase n=1 Tax=Chryseotalea sanaruensis TaxID=2482724 RepID=A0A401U7C3_9BACT|nr:chorismate synthase [Chryseotalea sanaruensis]GCC50785.1 chorismate synthase [Chryseotalea sanaruensis]
MNTYGTLFRITTFGESHGPSIGVVVDGCPAGLPVDEVFIQQELARRKPGQSKITTQRKEDDAFKILSGVFEGKTTGMPIALVIENQDQRSKDYSHVENVFRPSHADYTYEAKYGHRDHRGGGRSSARETAARVAAGAIAKLFLRSYGVTIQAFVSQVGDIKAAHYTTLDLSKTEDNIVRCPDATVADKMIELIDAVRLDRDTIGGLVTCVIKNTPVGLGEPVFDKLHAELGKAMLSINAVKGFEYGSGFEGITLRGSEHNDLFYTEEGQVRTKTNFSGGVQGGISNGEDIYFNVAFKPVATIMQDQETVDKDNNPAVVSGKGRHDPCVVPRAVPIVEAMAALVIADFVLRTRTSKL